MLVWPSLLSVLFLSSSFLFSLSLLAKYTSYTHTRTFYSTNDINFTLYMSAPNKHLFSHYFYNSFHFKSFTHSLSPFLFSFIECLLVTLFFFAYICVRFMEQLLLCIILYYLVETTDRLDVPCALVAPPIIHHPFVIRMCFVYQSSNA